MNWTCGPFGLFFYWLPANLLQLKTPLLLMTGTKAREATNQFNLEWFSDTFQFLRLWNSGQEEFVGVSMLEAPGANTKERENPSAGGSERVRLNWKDDCWRVITLCSTGKTTLTMPSPAFTSYFLSSLKNRKTMHIKRLFLFPINTVGGTIKVIWTLLQRCHTAAALLLTWSHTLQTKCERLAHSSVLLI